MLWEQPIPDESSSQWYRPSMALLRGSGPPTLAVMAGPRIQVRSCVGCRNMGAELLALVFAVITCMQSSTLMR